MPPTSGGQEIAHGRAATGADGSFEVKFAAKPDLSVSEKDEPMFEYTVYADVTDTTGETRSGQQTIRVGYTALQATLTADDWQTVDKPVQVTIKTSTLDGEGQLAEGSLKIYRLQAAGQSPAAGLERPPHRPSRCSAAATRPRRSRSRIRPTPTAGRWAKWSPNTA